MNTDRIIAVVGALTGAIALIAVMMMSAEIQVLRARINVLEFGLRDTAGAVTTNADSISKLSQAIDSHTRTMQIMMETR